MNMIRNLALSLFFLPAITYSDVYITLEATLVSPACIVTGANGEKELIVKFPNVSVEKITEAKETLQIVIEKCDLKKKLQMYILPRDGDTVMMFGQQVLATSIDGLGIRLTEKNKSTLLPFYVGQQIVPTVNGTKGYFSIDAQLTRNKTIEDLQANAGPFRAAVSIMIDYI